MQRSAAWFTATAVVLALAAAACGGGDSRPPATPGSQATVPQETTTVTLTPQQTERPTQATPTSARPTPQPGGPVGGEPPGGATVVSPTPLPSVIGVPDDWKTFTQESNDITEGFSFRYPSGWFVHTGTAGPPGGPAIGLGIVLTPWDFTRPPMSPPPGSLKVDVAVGPPQYGCGPEVAEPTESLGGVPATRAVIDYPDKEGELVRVESVAAERAGRLYCVQAYHTGPLETEEVFATLLHSFKFTR